MKIKVTREDTEIEGTIEKGFVKPFGTSAHIPIGKKHFGKEVTIVIASEPKYCWLITDQEVARLIKVATKVVNGRGGRMEHHYNEHLENLKKDVFPLISLIKIVTLLKERDIEKELVRKIKKLYSI